MAQSDTYASVLLMMHLPSGQGPIQYLFKDMLSILMPNIASIGPCEHAMRSEGAQGAPVPFARRLILLGELP